MKKSTGSESWETVSTGGFAPAWKPQREGESIVIRPIAGRMIPAHGKIKAGPALDAILLSGGTSTSFYTGDKKADIKPNSTICVFLSFALLGTDKLAYETGKGKNITVTLSPLSQAAVREKVGLMIVFDGKVKGGQGSVKRFTIKAPLGLRDKLTKK